MGSSRRHLVKYAWEPADLHDLRCELKLLLAELPCDLSSDVELAVDEAVANAVLHGRGADGIVVHAAVDGAKVTVTIKGGGKGFDVSRLAGTWPPALDARGGRGVYLMARLMDSVVIDVSRGTLIHMSRTVSGGTDDGQPSATALSPTQTRLRHGGH